MKRKPNESLPRHEWARIERHWRLGDTIEAVLAARHGVHSSTIGRRARRKGWPPPGSGADDTALQLRVAFDDLCVALSEPLAHWQTERPNETLKEIRERRALVRAIQGLVRTMQVNTPVPALPQAAAPIDHDKARADVLARLSRLAEVQEGDPAAWRL